MHDAAITVVNMHVNNINNRELSDAEKGLQQIEGVNIFSSYPKKKVNTLLARMKYAQQLKSHIKPLLKNHKIDTAIVYEPMGCYLIPFFKRNKVKTIYSERNTGEGVVSGKLLKRLVAQADVITCNSENAKIVLGQGLNRNVYLIKNGIASRGNTSNNVVIPSHQDAIRILVPARIAPVKNQMEVVELVNMFGHLSINAIFAGKIDDQEYFKAIKEKIDAYHLADNISIPGFVDNIDDLYNSSDIVLLPSFEEGMPNVLLECFAKKKMVLCSNIKMNCITDQVTKHAFDPKDSRSLYDSFNWYLNAQKEELQQYLEANYQYVIREHSVDKMVSSFIDLVKQ